MQILFNELKKYKISLLLILFFTYISTISELMIPLLLANALNVGIIQNYGINYIKNIALTMTFFIAITIILNTIISYLINKISIYTSTNIKNNLFTKILTLKSAEINKFSKASLLTRTTNDINQIKGFTTSLLSTIFKAPILFINCVTVLYSLNNNFSILLIISIIILLIYLIIVIMKLIPISKKIQTKLDNINNLIKEKITGIKLIKSYNNLNYQDAKIKNANNDYLKLSQKVIKITSFINPLLNLIINSIIIIILSMSISLIQNNNLEVGTIIATIQYILQILLSIIMLSMIAILSPKVATSLTRIKEVMDSESYSFNNEEKILDISSISFNNLNLILNENKILENITIKLNKNENIGIIGPTGSGKSTIARLIMKEYENISGEIKINDIDINELSRKDITTSISYLPQYPTILTGSILENIMFSNPKLQMDELSKIIYTCNLVNFVSSKEEKLNYKIEQNGANLSTGQKQRISLARTLASNNKFIILDEPTSSLDYKNEKEIINNLFTLNQDKTFVIISKRISSIMNCKKIIVMEKGKIIAIDTHENLLKNCELYKQMYSLQKEVLEYDI